MAIADNITGLVGNTPMVYIRRLAQGFPGKIAAKLESFNPCSSSKDRIALAMIEDAEKKGLVDADTVIVEPTSGNTGIGLAFVCAQRGYKLVLTMPSGMSPERRNLLKLLGAELVLTAPEKGMAGAIAESLKIAEKYPRSFIPDQFSNSVNPAAHERTTGPEIWDATDGAVDIFVAGVGTGGTLAGTGAFLKRKNPRLHIVAVEPEDSPVLSGGSPGPHKIQGIGAGFVPQVLKMDLMDEILKISNDRAFAVARDLARKEGILAGISGGAALAAALDLAEREENAGKLIVTVLPDTGERYLSVWSDASGE